jgi:hypothetical protein
MKQLAAAVLTLTAVVAGIVVATSLSSAAQEDDGSGDTTTTTMVDESEFTGRFGFRFNGDLPPALDELKACLAEQGIEIPEDPDHMFELRSENIEGLGEALEACGLPLFGEVFPFGGRLHDGFPFEGEMPMLPGLDELKTCLTEQGIEIPDDLDHMFELRGGDIDGLAEALEACGVAAFGDRFPFDGELLEGFPFGGDRFGFRFGGELPDGFPFGEDGLGFRFGGPPLDLDELAACLTDLGSFDSVDQVRDKLEECLPGPTGFGGLEGFEGIPGHGRNGFGFHFDGRGHFGFDLDPAPELEGSST